MADDRNTKKNAGEANSPWWVFLLAGVVVIALAGAGYWFLTSGEAQSAAEPPPPPLVTAAEVQRAERVAIVQTGFVRPLSEVEVTSEIAGRIQNVDPAFRRGRFVEEGQTLVTLETARLDAAVSRAEAGVRQAEAALAAAELERDRNQQLENEDFASEAQLQDAIVNVSAREADLASAEADLIDARNARDDATITAPFDALVVEATADPGDFAGTGAVLGRLVASAAVELELGLTPRDLALLGSPEIVVGGRVLVRGTGQAAVDAADDRPVIAVGVVNAIGPEIAETTRTVPLLVRVPEPFSTDREGRPLRIGELVELELPLDVTQRAALNLPPEALKGGNLVWEISDGALVRHEVETLVRTDGEVVVASPDLSPGALVLVSDLAAAADGTEVRLDRDQEDGDGASSDAGSDTSGSGGGG